MLSSTRAKFLMVCALLIVVALVAPVASPYAKLLAARVCIIAVLAMSVDLLLGFTGLPSLGQAALVMREKTEHPEGIEAGACRLVGTNPETISDIVLSLLDDRDA